jgi:hypothetical protein
MKSLREAAELEHDNGNTQPVRFEEFNNKGFRMHGLLN